MTSGIKFTYEYVKNCVEDFGCELISTEYISKDKNIKIRCPSCLEPFSTSFARFKRSKHHVCKKCSSKITGKLYSFSYDYVKEYIESFGCKLNSNKYVNNTEKLDLICSCGRPWKIRFSDFYSDVFCHKCRKCSKKDQVKKASLKSEDVYKIVLNYGYKLSSEYINNHEKIILEDNLGYLYHIDYGTFYMTIIKNNGKLEFVSTYNKFSFDNIKKYLSYNNDLNFKILDGYYIGANENTILCKCNVCNETWDNNWDFIRQKLGCPYCSGKRVSVSKSFGTLYPDLLDDWVYSKNLKTPYEYLPFSNAYIVWNCKKCGQDYRQRICKKTAGHGCNLCKMSGGEKRIKTFLEENKMIFDYDKIVFKDLVGDFGNLRYDFIVYKNEEKTNIKIILEFDGIQHDLYIANFFGSDIEKFKKAQRYDKIKDDYAKNNGYKLLRIKQKEFNNIQEILERELQIIGKEESQIA